MSDLPPPFIRSLRGFLLVVHPLVLRTTITDCLDTRPEVLNWFSPFANLIFMVSRENVTELAKMIRQGLPGVQLLITEVEAKQADGWLMKDAWQFLHNPKSSGRWDSPTPPSAGLKPLPWSPPGTTPEPQNLIELLLGGKKKRKICAACRGTGKAFLGNPCIVCGAKGYVEND